MFASYLPGHASVAFVSRASLENGTVTEYGLKKRVEPVKGCRTVSKRDMKYNDAMPRMKVDPERYTVEADGVVRKAEPSSELPMAQFAYVF